jgi:hypothetical protein
VERFLASGRLSRGKTANETGISESGTIVLELARQAGDEIAAPPGGTRLDASAALRETLARVCAGNPYVKIQHGPPEGWLGAAALVADGAPHLDRLLAQVGAEAETERSDVMASFFFGGYGWLLASIGVGCFLVDRRVPSLAAEDVAFRFEKTGHAAEAALFSNRLTVLPDDPTVGDPAVTVVPNVPTLRAALRRVPEAHLAPVVAAVRARAPLGTRALWLSVADDIAGSVVEHGKGEDQPVAALREEIAALVGAAGAAWRGRTGVIEIEADGRREAFMARASCCLNDKLAASAHCVTCPLVPAEERYRRLQAYMAEQEHGAVPDAAGAAN